MIRVAVSIYGGLVSSVVASEPVEVYIFDRDNNEGFTDHMDTLYEKLCESEPKLLPQHAQEHHVDARHDLQCGNCGYLQHRSFFPVNTGELICPECLSVDISQLCHSPAFSDALFIKAQDELKLRLHREDFDDIFNLVVYDLRRQYAVQAD